MPTFGTAGPVSATVDIFVGDIRIVASDRSDVVVEVRPSDSANRSDVSAAEQTRVEFDDGRLQVKAPKGWRQYTPLGGRESIDIHIELPSGSDVRAEASMTVFRCVGRLGDCLVKTGMGGIRLDQAASAQLRTGAGDIIADRVEGNAEINTGSGVVRVGTVGGSATVKNGNGDTWIGEITGEIRVNAANGKVSVDQAHGSAMVKSANGDIRLQEVERGHVHAQTACGRVDIGILDGTAAWLDVKTGHGAVQNDMDAVRGAEPGEETVEVYARSSFGDITVRRASPVASDVGRSSNPEGRD